MKTAVSMPDDFSAGPKQRLVALRVSRSQLYARAIEEFLKAQQGNAIYGTPERRVLADVVRGHQP
jgi:hypothetical protein